MEGTLWAFLPAVIAIVLALVTKQVYISLFFGIFVGAMMYAGGNPLKALFTLYQVMSEKVGGNTPIIVFLVVLGILVVLMQKSGGAKAYGDWAGKKIKSKGGALAATAGLGCLIFVDDYFNCLTVGSVMRPVTDKFKISRAKLAYIIDATAAPVCIIAPISSWAAAVAGELEGDGLMVFISTIPFNVYALLTLVMVFSLCFFKFDFGKMKPPAIFTQAKLQMTKRPKRSRLTPEERFSTSSSPLSFSSFAASAVCSSQASTITGIQVLSTPSFSLLTSSRHSRTVTQVSRSLSVLPLHSSLSLSTI